MRGRRTKDRPAVAERPRPGARPGPGLVPSNNTLHPTGAPVGPVPSPAPGR